MLTDQTNTVEKLPELSARIQFGLRIIYWET